MLGLALALAAGFSAGCGNVFISKHKVMVDAISAPGVAKPSGLSYRLLAKKATVSNAPMQVPVVKACIDAALTGVGMFDAPSNVAPDIFIEVTYGVESGPRADPSTRETYLQLSGRANPDREMERATGAEIWDVRVGVFGVAGRPETAMPLLAAVAVDYIGTDTKAEAKVDVPRNLPAIAAVRETAIKALEGKAAARSNASEAATVEPLTAPPAVESAKPETPAPEPTSEPAPPSESGVGGRD